jgi:hypothetical protein
VSLLFDWWGGNDVVDLPATGGVTSIDFDSAWVAAKWGATWSEMESARLLVKADGYTPMLSEPFPWLGQTKGGNVVSLTSVAFRNQTISVARGARQAWTLSMRRPVPRRLRFVDQDGRPVAGLGMEVHMFWTAQNHCGHFEGDPISHGKTDAQGRIAVPDGEFDYGVSIDGPSVFDGEGVFFQHVVAVDGPETTVAVHTFDHRTLTGRVVNGNEPVAGARVMAVDRYIGCMDPGLRLLGTTDAMGSVVLRDFAPDRYDAVGICRDDRELWRGEPMILMKPEGVDIAAPHQVAKADVPPCTRIEPVNPQVSKSRDLPIHEIPFAVR